MSRKLIVSAMVLILLCGCAPAAGAVDNLEINDSGRVYHIYCMSMGKVVFESSANNISRWDDFIFWTSLDGHKYQWRGDYLVTTEVQ